VKNLKLAPVFASIAGAAALAFSTPAAAQLTVYQDYTPSEEVVEMTLVNVDSGMMETYFEGLRGTWVEANEVAKGLGHIVDYGIWAVPYGDDEGFNLILTIRMANTGATGPSKARYDAFMKAWGDANIEQSNKTVRDLYNKIRTIKGTYLLREIEIPVKK
jgi:hypothetical protein